MFTIDDYFYWSGVIATTIILLMLFIFALDLFIWPMIEAVSICRWYAAIGKVNPSVKPKNGWIRVWWSYTKFGGRFYSSMTNKFGRWNGVGDWQVYDDKAADREGKAKS